MVLGSYLKKSFSKPRLRSRPGSHTCYMGAVTCMLVRNNNMSIMMMMTTWLVVTSQSLLPVGIRYISSQSI